MNRRRNLQGYDRIIRYIGISFLSMLAAILLVGGFFYLQLKEMQEKYNANVQRTYERLELVNKLFENKELSRNLLRNHVLADTKTEKDSVRRELARLYKLNETHINRLHLLLKQEPNRLERVHKLNSDLKSYHTHVDSLFRLSYSQQREKAMAYTSTYLAPFFIRNQAHLISLNNDLTTSARNYTNVFFPVFSTMVDEYILLLFLVIPFILWVSFAFNRITKRLQRENQRLNKEIEERKGLQQTLELSELNFKRLFDNNPIPMLVYDQYTYRFLEANEAAVLEYGYTREEFLQKTIFEIRPKEEVERVKNRLTQMDKALDAITENFVHKRKDGSVFKVKLRSHAFPEKDGIYPRLVTSENVQKQEDFIDRLAKNEKQLREVSSSIPGAVYQFEIKDFKEMTIPFVSDGIIELFGVTPEEVYSNPNVLFEAVHPHDLDQVRDSLSFATHNFLPWMQDLRIWNKHNGKWTWIRGHSLPSSKEDGMMLYNGTFIDITDQKEAQAQLKASEANLRALLDSSPQAIYLLDKDLNVLLFNAVAAEEIKTLMFRELEVGQNILSFTTEDQKPVLIESHNRAMQGKPTLYETGSGEFWFEVAFRPVFTQEKQVIAVALSIHDITEQRNIISAIRDSEAKLTRAQNLAKLGSWEYDLQRDTLNISDYMYTIYGIPSELFTVTFNSLMAFIHPEDMEKATQEYQRVIDDRMMVISEHRILLDDGTQKFLHHNMEPLMNYEGKVLKVIGTTLDITEQKEKERELREAKNRFQSTIENIPEIILSADPQFRIFYISPQCKAVTGYSENEFTQEHLWPKLIHPDDLAVLQERLQNEVLAGEKIQHEIRIRSRNGKIKWVLLRMSPMLGRNGKILRIDASVADVTERKLVEAKRTLLTEQLQVQNQNLQQFAYIVSHNLRAPIANILGLTNIYNREKSGDEHNKNVVENLSRSAKHLDNTIRDLNDILTVRGQILDVTEEVCFEETLKDILKSISIELQNTNATVDFNFTKAPCMVSLRSYVHSILQNLITNAIKYRSPDRNPQIYVRSYKQKDYICLEISDNGLGIDLANAKGKLFGLYKRFHPHIEGRGLGLHLVKTQVELLEGKIEVDSKVGVGTTFRVYILKQA